MSVMNTVTAIDVHTNKLFLNRIESPIGQIIAIASNDVLYILDFYDKKSFDSDIEKLEKATNARLSAGDSRITILLEQELVAYFSGTLKHFTTPICTFGTPFQKQAWEALKKIPYGKTISYLEQAHAINNPKAIRAVARANGANKMSIILPCHRVIGSDGSLTGYGGGIERKRWLLHHEKEHFTR